MNSFKRVFRNTCTAVGFCHNFAISEKISRISSQVTYSILAWDYKVAGKSGRYGKIGIIGKHHIPYISVFRPKYIPSRFLTTGQCVMSSSYTNNNIENMDQQETKQGFRYLKEEPLYGGKWLSLNKVSYQNPSGETKTWEAVERTTRNEGSTADAVCMIAILKRVLHYDCMVFVKQYRPAMKCYTIEFPAGLIDPNEKIDDTAIRELKEETGYTGTISHSGIATSLDPGVSNCTVVQVSMQIDGDDPININKAKRTDGDEFIEVVLVPVHEILHKLKDLAKDENVVIDSRVYSYAVGFQQSKEFFRSKKI